MRTAVYNEVATKSDSQLPLPFPLFLCSVQIPCHTAEWTLLEVIKVGRWDNEKRKQDMHFIPLSWT